MLNVVLIVVDSLRAASLRYAAGPDGYAKTPFLDRLGTQSVFFVQAHATECWTLPAHMSMFTGLMPSEHGAHFQSMAYSRADPTIAEILSDRGYFTECITRNSLFDGTVPGALRGFQSLRVPLADVGMAALPTLLFSTLAKPRVRRLIERSGFFGAIQKSNRQFLWRLVRMGMPTDELALSWALRTMALRARQRRPLFLFVNLYDVHAPYCPTDAGPLPPLTSLEAFEEALALPRVLPLVTSHAYLRPGFAMPERDRMMLLRRYHRAIELIDKKLARFFDTARTEGLLAETLLIITSDHGEAFGDHGLYLHDASVYETHLHVPLWIIHPDVPPHEVRDVVSTRALFGLANSAALGADCSGTLLDPDSADRTGTVHAEHFYYPALRDCLPLYRMNQTAIISRSWKQIQRGAFVEEYDLEHDPQENGPATPRLPRSPRAPRLDSRPQDAISRNSVCAVTRQQMRGH